MLCLLDAALAHVVIAASKIAQNRRRAWLIAVAQRLECDKPVPLKPLAASTRRTRHWRRRKADGVAVLRVKVDVVDTPVVLCSLGLLDPRNADDREALAHGVERAIATLSDLSQRNEFRAARILTQLVLKKK
jgi:hypothetical protein